MARLKKTHQAPTLTPYSLNEQIRQLQQQMADELALQQQRQQQHAMTERAGVTATEAVAARAAAPDT